MFSMKEFLWKDLLHFKNNALREWSFKFVEYNNIKFYIYKLNLQITLFLILKNKQTILRYYNYDDNLEINKNVFSDEYKKIIILYLIFKIQKL